MPKSSSDTLHPILARRMSTREADFGSAITELSVISQIMRSGDTFQRWQIA